MESECWTSGVRFLTCGGVAGLPVLLAAVDLNGIPIFVRLAIGSFDAQGQWPFGGTVPSGLEGLVADFQSFGFYQPTKVGMSNRAKVTFQ